MSITSWNITLHLFQTHSYHNSIVHMNRKGIYGCISHNLGSFLVFNTEDSDTTWKWCIPGSFKCWCTIRRGSYGRSQLHNQVSSWSDSALNKLPFTNGLCVHSETEKMTLQSRLSECEFLIPVTVHSEWSYVHIHKIFVKSPKAWLESLSSDICMSTQSLDSLCDPCK